MEFSVAIRSLAPFAVELVEQSERLAVWPPGYAESVRFARLEIARAATVAVAPFKERKND